MSHPSFSNYPRLAAAIVTGGIEALAVALREWSSEDVAALLVECDKYMEAVNEFVTGEVNHELFTVQSFLSQHATEKAIAAGRKANMSVFTVLCEIASVALLEDHYRRSEHGGEVQR